MSYTERPSQLVDFEYLLNSSLQNFINASNVLGEPMISLASRVRTAFERTRDVIVYGLFNSEPTADHEVMVQYYRAVKDIVEFKESATDNQFANHFATVREAIVALGWVNVRPAPTQFIRDMREAGEYYANRVLLNNKGNQDHMNWVNKWNQLLVDLQKYVASNYLTGFTWGTHTQGRGDYDAGPPPPPAAPFSGFGSQGEGHFQGPVFGGFGPRDENLRGPPPPPPPSVASSYGFGGDGSRQALLNQLNQGTNITRNLRPAQLRSIQKDSPDKATYHSGKVSQAEKAVYQPKFILEGRKWVVEHQKKNLGMIVNNDDMSQSLAMYHCEDSFLKVENKINSVVLDTCKKTNVILKDVISSVELIRCDRVKLQCDGTVPLISLDNCESVQIFLAEKSRNVEIISSKSSSCNICLIEPDGDYKELSIPEQIKTVVSGKKLASSPIEKN